MLYTLLCFVRQNVSALFCVLLQDRVIEIDSVYYNEYICKISFKIDYE